MRSTSPRKLPAKLPSKPWREKYWQHGASMDLTEHLDELRDRIIWCLAAFVLGLFFVGLPLNGVVLQLLEFPFHMVQGGESTQPVVLEVGADGTLRLSEAARRTLQGTPAANGDAPTTLSLERSRLALRDAAGNQIIWGKDFTQTLFFFNPIDPFMLKLQIAILLAVLTALPAVLWNVWRFISPGLTSKELSFVRRGLQSALILFPLGVVFAYFLIGYAMYFFLNYGEGLTPAISITSYVRLTLMMMIVMGIVFEFPLVMLLLLRVGIVDLRTLEKNRPIVIAVLLIVGAVLTPPDPFTMLAVALPLYVLFEVTLLIARAMGLRTPPAKPEVAPAPTPGGKAESG